MRLRLYIDLINFKAKMKRKFSATSALLAMLLFAACVSRPKLIDNNGHPVAADFRTCPFGHRRLMNVPIKYGFPWFSTQEELEENNRKLEALEYWHGGDVVYDVDPNFKVICRECRVVLESCRRYDHLRLSWRIDRRSEPDKFPIPFPELFLKFPWVGHENEEFITGVIYSITLTLDGLPQLYRFFT